MTRPVHARRLGWETDVPACSTTQNHSFTYDEPIRVESVTQAVSDLALRFGEGADEEEATMVRFSLLLPLHAVGSFQLGR